MKATCSLLFSCALILGATSLVFGNSRKSENSASHASTTHRSRAHHHSTGTHRNSTNSGSKKSSNVPAGSN
jgi:hypothetical protein